jgi:CheY-like chemotaxis protein
MKTGLKSRSLFAKQVSEHTRLLSTLLEASPRRRVDEKYMEKCIVSTKMLANSASLLGLRAWEELLTTYESLLIMYRNEGRPWDERVAQVTSEMIEREEDLLAALEKQDEESSVLSGQDAKALIDEMSCLLEMEYVPEETPVDEEEMEDGASAAEGDEPEPELRETAPGHEPDMPEAVTSLQEPPGGDEEAASREATDAEEGGTSSRIVPLLRSACSELMEELAGLAESGEARRTAVLANIEKQAALIDFYANALREGSKPDGEAIMTTLEPVKSAMEDFADSLAEEQCRTVHVGFLGEGRLIEARLLIKAADILRNMVTDICTRCNEEYLRIEIDVEDRAGALFWKVRDNGENFITDSKLDREDFLAFYPGLRKVRKELRDCGGVLWVEPSEDHDTRFAFSMPISTEKYCFKVWGKEKDSFAVLSSQICRIVPLEQVRKESDSRGESVVVDGKYIPLVNLSLVCSDAPAGGDKVVVLGSLEKRIAFTVQGDGLFEEGLWLRDTIQMWKGLSRGIAKMDDRKVPLIEAEELVRGYLSLMGSGGSEEISGGVFGLESSHSQSQANLDEDTPSPPEPCKEEEVDVVVIERSDVLRDSFEELFAEEKIKAKIFERLADAKEFIGSHSPRLIISEFRTPTMAAKEIIEELDEKGKPVPVLVTTALEGEKAELLVGKLKASGYIVKPLDPVEVLNTIRPMIGARP